MCYGHRKRHRRQRARVRVRDLVFAALAALVLLAVLLPLCTGWRIKREREALRMISHMGGTYTMDAAVDPDKRSAALPGFVRRLFVRRVYAIDLSADALSSFPAEVRVGREPLTDEGLVHVTAFKRIERLDLEDAPIGDAAVPHLKELRSLHHLNLRGTQVTEAGVQELRNALPDCEILS
jgi:hypothetical protein